MSAEFFGRFGYDITEDINAYVQGSWAESGNFANWSPWIVSSAGSRPQAFFANNPFLSPTAQAQLMTGTRFLPAAPATSPQTGSTPPPPPAGVPYFASPSYMLTMSTAPMRAPRAASTTPRARSVT